MVSGGYIMRTSWRRVDTVNATNSIVSTNVHFHSKIGLIPFSCRRHFLISLTVFILRGEEERVWGDAGYVGIEKRDEHKARKVQWFIACRPGKLRGLPKRCDTRATEKIKAQIRAKVEHPFLYIKRMFAYTKVRYKGLAKNHDRLCLLAGFYNLIRMDRLVS